MQNEFLPEETPPYQPPAPLAQQTETAQTTQTAAVSAALATRQATRRKRLKRQYRRRAVAFIAGLLVAGLTVFSGIMVISALMSVASPFTTLALTLGLMAAALAYIWRIIQRKPLLQAKDSAEMGGAEAVGPLLEMLGSAVYERDLRALYDALTPRLRALESGSAAGLAPRHHHLLRQCLWNNTLPTRLKPPETDFCLAALAAIEKMGDAKFVPVVERIARMRAPTPDRERIRDAAAECLPRLKARLSSVADAQILLRASAPESAGSNTLLRAAAGPNSANPNELVRPSDRSE